VNQRITSLLAALFVVLLSAFAGAQTLDDEIRERLTPAGSVCVFGEECAAGLAVAGGASGPRDGETIYNTFCMACHATGVSEAPILGNAEQWEARVAKGVDALYSSSINGLNVMPPRGTCVDCTDEEMQDAVDFILDALQ
jgi:cytochrome c5